MLYDSTPQSFIMSYPCLMDQNTFFCAYNASSSLVEATPPWFQFTLLQMQKNEQVRLFLRVFLIVSQYTLLPMFYAYMWRAPAPQVNINLARNYSASTEAPQAEVELDDFCSEVLENLKRCPTGTSAKHLLRSLTPFYDWLELYDIHARLADLQTNGLVRQCGQGLWIAL